MIVMDEGLLRKTIKPVHTCERWEGSCYRGGKGWKPLSKTLTGSSHYGNGCEN